MLIFALSSPHLFFFLRLRSPLPVLPGVPLPATSAELGEAVQKPYEYASGIK